MPDRLLACRNLVCGHEGKPVLTVGDLTVYGGESIAILGPNGSGKSTFLKTVAKTLPRLGGEILLGASPLDALGYDEVARKVAFVPQEEPAFFPFPVRDVVLMGRIARSHGLFESREDNEAAVKAMEQADCSYLADRPVTSLSGGEKQRVMIARALAQDASLVLLDEPTSHLDAAHQIAVTRLVGAMAAEGRGILVAVHDLNLAALMATRAVLVNDSQVVLDAPVEDVLKDERLDDVYQVRFHRVEVDGRVIVVPAR